jgi:hypothetical protein
MASRWPASSLELIMAGVRPGSPGRSWGRRSPSETEALPERTVAAMRDALAAAVEPPLPSPRLALPEADPEGAAQPLCAKVAGFSLHVAHAVAASDRAGLERLCRYGLRAPFAQERLARRADGRVVYHLRRPWPNAPGATCLVLAPLDLLRRLAALVPAPYSYLVRYHGVVANRSRWRPRLPRPLLGGEAERCQPGAAPAAAHAGVSGAESGGGAEPEPGPQPAAEPTAATAEAAPVHPPSSTATAPSRRRPLPWAQLWFRVFFIDALRCPRCSAAMVVLALISDPKVVSKILRHLRLPTEPPPLARANPAYGLRPLTPNGVAFLDTVPADEDAGDRPGSLDSRPGSARPPP